MKKLILILTLAAFAGGPIAEAQASHVTPIAAMHKAAGKHHKKKAVKHRKHNKKAASHKRASL